MVGLKSYMVGQKSDKSRNNILHILQMLVSRSTVFLSQNAYSYACALLILTMVLADGPEEDYRVLPVIFAQKKKVREQGDSE